MAATRPRAAGKGTARSGAGGGAAGRDDDAAERDAPKVRGPREARPRRGVGVFATVVTILAGVFLIVGVALMWMGMYAYENLNMAGTYTVDQQIGMATAGVTAGTGLVVGGLVTLGLVFVGLRLGRT